MWQLAFPAPFDDDGDGLFDGADGEGRAATLRTDPTQDLFDSFDRLLAYVSLTTGRDIGRTQIRWGWATTFVFEEPFKRVRAYRRVERAAERAGSGVWGICGGRFNTPARD